MAGSGISTDVPDLHKSLAEYLITIHHGEPILSIRDLSLRIGVSTGSISHAIKDLEQRGAVSISRRGRMGSFLGQKSLGRLWNIIEPGPLVLALTMPSFPKSEGLATAIYCLLNNAEIETYLIFIRGSYNRLKTLRDGRCHGVIISGVAAEKLCGDQDQIVSIFPPQSFVTDHRVFFRADQTDRSDPLKIAIDRDSFDIEYLTEMEYGDREVSYRQITYMQIGRHLLEGFVDEAIWNMDQMIPFMSSNIDSRPMSAHVLREVGDKDTSAAVVIRSGYKHVEVVIQEVLKTNEVLSIQEKVLSGQMVPRY